MGGAVSPHTYEIRAQWDAGAAVWVAESDDVPGLIAEADSPSLLFRHRKLSTFFTGTRIAAYGPLDAQLAATQKREYDACRICRRSSIIIESPSGGHFSAERSTGLLPYR